MKPEVKKYTVDTLFAVIAGLIVSVAYYFFQNSNGFAPGGVGGLATITYHFVGDFIKGEFVGGSLSWAVLMLAFNLPIFVLVSIFVNRKSLLYIALEDRGQWW